MRSLTLALLALCAHTRVAPAQVLFVDDDAPMTGDGSSWANAYPSLTLALWHHDFDPPAVQEIRVAEGTYLPVERTDAGDPRTAVWLPRADLVLRGGYAGDPGQPDLRDPELYPSVLSGDLGVANDASDNSWHVVRFSSALDETTVLDGFVVEGGNADRNQDRGAGLSVSGSPLVVDCVVRHNHADFQAGGMHNTGAGHFVRCRFEENSSNGFGAGVFSTGSARFEDCDFRANSSPQVANALWTRGSTYERCSFRDHAGQAVRADEAGSAWMRFIDCEFSGNAAHDAHGAALSSNDGYMRLVRCIFRDNDGTTDGGGLDGGAVKFIGDELLVVDCRFHGNSVEGRGGAIYSMAQQGTRIVNSVFTGNSATTTGGAVHTGGSDSALSNSVVFGNQAGGSGGGLALTGSIAVVNTILWGNTDGGADVQQAQLHVIVGSPLVEFDCVEGWTGSLGGTGNFGDDPQLVDPDGADDVVGTLDDDLSLSAGSPCLDAGSNPRVSLDFTDQDDDGDLLEPTPFDLAGELRFQDEPGAPNTGAGSGPLVDLGAFEREGCRAHTYCLSAPNSAGPGASIDHRGVASIAVNDFVLQGAGAVTNQSAIFYYGNQQTQQPFGDGWRCVGGQTFRLPVISTGGGSPSYALNLQSFPNPQGEITPGSTWFFQLWYRDPSGPGISGFNLSNGLAVTFCP